MDINETIKEDQGDQGDQGDQRPQISHLKNKFGDDKMNSLYRNLTNHELHLAKNLYTKDMRKESHTIMDENLGTILDKCINFVTYSIDDYNQKIDEAELIIDKYEDKSIFEIFKTHMLAISLFIRDKDNIIYIGIVMIFLSIIIYLSNIIIE